MKKLLSRITLDDSVVSYRHIRDQVRELILSGQIAPGSRFPSTQELSAHWKVDGGTVHAALAPLVKEGLLSRIPRKGTFVRKREEQLTRVGVYCQAAPFHQSLYLQALQVALRDELAKQGIEIDARLDFRAEEQRGEPWLPLVKAVERREFQALIATCVDHPILRWLQKLSVPIAVQGSPPDMPNRVGSDMEQFVDLSLQSLAQQGCRSVGLIAPPPPEPIYVDFFRHFIDVCHDLGLAARNEWLRMTRHEEDLCRRSAETFGYKRFLRLWKQQTKPDGLVVYDDVTARGVITALLEKQVRVPEELKLVLHKNESIDLLCPMPATFVVNSESAVARALITQVQKQCRGERCEPIILPHRLMVHSGSREPGT